MSLDHAAFMLLALGIKVCGMSLFWRIEQAQTSLDSVLANLRAPLIPLSTHAEQANLVVLARRAPILLVDSRRDQPKIFDAVIRSYAIDVVDLPTINAPVNVYPCQSVRVAVMPPNGQFEIAVRYQIPTRTTASFATKQASFWVVGSKLTQALHGYIGFSHEALQLLIGQRPASVDALRGPCHFLLQKECWQ